MSKLETKPMTVDENTTEFDILRASPMKRRAFLTRMSAAGLGAAAASLMSGSLLAGCGGSNGGGIGGVGGGANNFTSASFPAVAGRPLTGKDINGVVLNYALTLEILEADLYRQALNKASGKALTTPLAADPASYTLAIPAGGVANAADSFKYLVDFSYVEAAHRDFLRAVITGRGETPAISNPGGYTFGAAGPGNDLKTILANILPLEETGVRAYLGAAPFLTDFSLATAAVGIYSTEARHSAVVSLELSIDPGPTPMAGDQKVTTTYPHPNTFEYFLAPATVIGRVGAFFVS